MGVEYVDIVRDVINLIPVHYVSHELVGLVNFLLYAFFWLIIKVGLPLKTKASLFGDWSEQETYEMFAAIAQYPFSYHLIGVMLNQL